MQWHLNHLLAMVGIRILRNYPAVEGYLCNNGELWFKEQKWYRSPANLTKSLPIATCALLHFAFVGGFSLELGDTGVFRVIYWASAELCQLCFIWSRWGLEYNISILDFGGRKGDEIVVTLVNPHASCASAKVEPGSYFVPCFPFLKWLWLLGTSVYCSESWEASIAEVGQKHCLPEIGFFLRFLLSIGFADSTNSCIFSNLNPSAHVIFYARSTTSPLAAFKPFLRWMDVS